MRNRKPADAVIKILIAVALLFIVIWMCVSRDGFVAKTCVDMPSPEETVSEFFDALIDGRYDECDAMISNYSTLGLTSSTDTQIGEQLFLLLRESYDYQILSGSAAPAVVSAADITSPTDASTLVVYSNVTAEMLVDALEENYAAGKNASQAVAFTYLDIRSISEDLHQKVSELAYNYAYQSIDVNNEETATRIVTEALALLSADIENYYRTDIFVIDMEYADSEWKIILSEDLYKAVIGNIA